MEQRFDGKKFYLQLTEKGKAPEKPFELHPGIEKYAEGSRDGIFFAKAPFPIGEGYKVRHGNEQIALLVFQNFVNLILPENKIRPLKHGSEFQVGEKHRYKLIIDHHPPAVN